MEFPFFVSNILQCDNDGFSVIDGQKPQVHRGSMAQNVGINAHLTSSHFGNRDSASMTPEQQFDSVVDKMGEASGRAQKLATSITSSMKLFNSDNILYMRAQGKQCIGLLKVGKRNLFIRGDNGGIKEMKPMCVLDFYVHESMQRGGHGKAIFEKMLQHQRVTPDKLAYDRPSEKLLGFLAKHYGLKKYVPQNNNFVVFDAYWQKDYKIPAQQNTHQYSQQNSQKQGSAYDRFGQYQQQNQEQERVMGSAISHNSKNSKQNGLQGNDIFGMSQQQNSRLPPKHNQDRDPRFSGNQPQRQEGIKRKLSNNGLQVMNNNSQDRRQDYGNDRGPKKQVSFNEKPERSQRGYDENLYGPQSYHNNFQKYQAKDKGESDMKTRYQQNMQNKSSSQNGYKVEQRGNNKGFSNDGVNNLMNLGNYGPLDSAQNNNNRKDVANHRMNNINGKINQYDQQIEQEQEQINQMNVDYMKKSAAATASNVNGFYNKRMSTGPIVGHNYPQEKKDQYRNTEQNFKDKNWNHKEAVNQLYNKRDTNYNGFYEQNKDKYQQRAHVDQQLAAHQKQMNDGKVGNRPWGTGYSSNANTTNQQIGSHYKANKSTSINGKNYFS